MVIALLNTATSKPFYRGKEMFRGFWKKGSVPAKPLNAQTSRKPQVLPQAVGRELMLILFDGWYDRKSRKARIKEMVKPEESLPRAA